jgi:hypothetical protein
LLGKRQIQVLRKKVQKTKTNAVMIGTSRPKPLQEIRSDNTPELLAKHLNCFNDCSRPSGVTEAFEQKF